MPEWGMADGPLLVLISGPYLTGTDGDEDKIAANLARMEARQGILGLIQRFPKLRPVSAPVGRGHPRYRGLRSYRVSVS